MWCANVVIGAPGISFASFAIRCSFVQTFPEPEVSAIFPSNDSTRRCPLPSTGSLGFGSPASSVLRDTPTPRRPSRLASFPSLGGTSSMSGDDEASQVPRGPSHACPALRPRRSLGVGPLVARDPPTLRCCLPVMSDRQPSRRDRSRSSVTRPACSLSTLRSRGRPRSTQDSLPGGGPAFLGRGQARRGPKCAFSRSLPLRLPAHLGLLPGARHSLSPVPASPPPCRRRAPTPAAPTASPA